MDEKTKVKVNQIIEMISIYQSGIGELNKDEKSLMVTDLNMKKVQLEEHKKNLSEQLDNVYAAGANEIDEEVNQLQSQIQKIENSLDIISDLLFEPTSFSIQTEEIKEKDFEKENIKPIEFSIDDTIESNDIIEKDVYENNNDNNITENIEENNKKIDNKIIKKSYEILIKLKNNNTQSIKKDAEDIINTRKKDIPTLLVAINKSEEASKLLMKKLANLF